MRTLLSALLAAQKKASGVPYVKVEVVDSIGGVKRLDWQRLYSGGEELLRRSLHAAPAVAARRERRYGGGHAVPVQRPLDVEAALKGAEDGPRVVRQLPGGGIAGVADDGEGGGGQPLVSRLKTGADLGRWCGHASPPTAARACLRRRPRLGGLACRGGAPARRCGGRAGPERGQRRPAAPGPRSGTGARRPRRRR